MGQHKEKTETLRGESRAEFLEQAKFKFGKHGGGNGNGGNNDSNNAGGTDGGNPDARRRALALQKAIETKREFDISRENSAREQAAAFTKHQNLLETMEHMNKQISQDYWVNRSEVVDIRQHGNGVVFLTTGSSKFGLQHILEGNNFRRESKMRHDLSIESYGTQLVEMIIENAKNGCGGTVNTSKLNDVSFTTVTSDKGNGAIVTAFTKRIK